MTTVELYRRYRPTSLEGLIGQDKVVKMVGAMLEKGKIPHCILASGPSGCGKTTIFRILRASLNCSDMDFKEINAADFRGIDFIRDIRQSLNLSPMNGDAKVWLVDECHQLTAQAQESFLKMLEDTPSHVYFFLASTDPQKLKKTIITRSTHLQLEALNEQQLAGLVSSVYRKETKQKLPQAIVDKIANLSDGSARKSLVLLHQIINLDMEDEDKILDALQSTSSERQSIEICRALLNPRTDWKTMAAILKGVTDDPEQIRWLVLGYMKSVALSGGKISNRACSIIDEFRDNFYDSKHAGLVVSCYRVIEGH
jgi:DNA polymerase-3 subunit gamma/tau